MTQEDDFGARDIWPFCPWPQTRRTKRGVKAEVEIKFARLGGPRRRPGRGLAVYSIVNNCC